MVRPLVRSALPTSATPVGRSRARVLDITDNCFCRGRAARSGRRAARCGSASCLVSSAQLAPSSFERSLSRVHAGLKGRRRRRAENRHAWVEAKGECRKGECRKGDPRSYNPLSEIGLQNRAAKRAALYKTTLNAAQPARFHKKPMYEIVHAFGCRTPV